ncbi:carbohydrate-binding domain-containing protein [Flammeovirgaceae bacterium SG7u.111]|nr:carbohydrate-binding domain-containing protein [Flammeovirgaceae bacterium SG7u.132]WPO34303.1 carbohydrate-binding domain-containing protein [Flammeovirgaceae bacterium SG7u.111]
MSHHLQKLNPFMKVMLAHLCLLLSLNLSHAQNDSTTIVDIAVENEDFSILVDALVRAGLVDALNGEGPFTVFAPTNAAFEKLFMDLGVDSVGDIPLDLLTTVLLYHVANPDVYSMDIEDGQELLTLANQTLEFTVDEMGIKVNDSNIDPADIIASNGVIHVIDMVLLPPPPTPITVYASGTEAKGGFASFKVYVNGDMVGEEVMTTNSIMPYSFETSLKPSEIENVAIHFFNDASEGRADRNLTVDLLKIGDMEFSPLASNVTYDRGELDGEDIATISPRKQMYWNGFLIFDVKSMMPVEGVKVKTSGTALDGEFAKFRVYVNGEIVGDTSSTASLEDYIFESTMGMDDVDTVIVEFYNDASRGAIDRNLNIESITVGSKTLVASSKSVTYDRGALDGEDITDFPGAMWWNGFLIFDFTDGMDEEMMIEEATIVAEEPSTKSTVAFSNGVKVYPNPVTDRLSVSYKLEKAGNVNLRIYEISGKTVFSESFQSEVGFGEKTIDISTLNLKTGIFFLNLSDCQNINENIKLIRY